MNDFGAYVNKMMKQHEALGEINRKREKPKHKEAQYEFGPGAYKCLP